MIARIALASLLALSLAAPACAEEMFHPDDGVAFDLSAEDWVTTQTAHVVLNAEAAVSAANAGNMRADMNKAVNDTAKGDWRLTSFTRTPDQTGLERWSASFEARLPESALGSLADAAKKASKAGMQVSVAAVDFTPTLDEVEAVRSGLRARLYKQAAAELTSLNTALPGRTYRIAQIGFDSAGGQMPFMQPRFMNKGMVAMSAVAPAPEGDSGIARSEKITQTAHILFATAPAAPATH
ncbi:MAG: hypothetical protein P4M15_14600 [Alphaproteobacteria bacterium]|nr:hypothetical protein [Alphaproteobacteria bacterium]